MRRSPRGTGTFRARPNGLIEHRVSLGHDADGKRQVLTVYGRKRAECVAAMARKLEAYRRHGGVPEPEDVTIGQWIDTWLDRRRAQRDEGMIAANTYGAYENALLRHAVPYLGRKRLDRLAVRDVDAWLRRLEEAGVGGRMRQYARMVLGAAISDAVRLEMVERNVVELVRAPRHRTRKFPIWDVDNAAAFLRAARADRFGALWVLALTSGPRPHELLGLRPADVADGSLTITEQLSRHGQERTRTKTERGQRTIDLTPLAIDALREHRERLLAEGLRASPWLFPTTEGTAMNYRNLIARHYDPIVARSGVPRIRPYDLRHTYATLALAAGVPLHVVSRSLGHASAAFTAATYAHLTETLERAHVDRIQALYAGALG